MEESRSFNPATFIRNAMRNSPWVVMAVALHMILFAAAAIFVTVQEKKKIEDESISVSVSKPKEKEEEPIQPPEAIDRKAIPKNEEAELVSIEEDVYIPTTEKVEDLFQERGDPDADNSMTTGAPGATAIGVGAGGHAGRTSPFSSRRPGNGLRKGRAGGPTQGTEKAVLDGLRWLCRHQNPDGSWGFDSLRERCVPEAPCYNPKSEFTDHYNEGLTSLALLCFLGAGFSHESKQDIVDIAMGKRYKIGEVVKNGLQWLAKKQTPEGSFTKNRPYMYNESLATMAMCEAYGLTQNRYWKEPAQRAVNFLMGAQRPNPAGQGHWGWRYASLQELNDQHRSGTMDETFKKELYDADSSVTTWAVMALKSAKLSGLTIQDEHMTGALDFIKWVTVDNGLVGYNDPKVAGAPVTGKNDHFKYHTAVMSALGACTRIFVNHDPDDPFLDLAAKRIIDDLPKVEKDGLSVDYYYWYYGSLALNQIDGPDSPKKSGKYWDKWNKAMVDAVLQLQDHTERGCTFGGWTKQEDRWCYAGGPLYATAINVLTLEVYYRYENAFGGAKRN